MATTITKIPLLRNVSVPVRAYTACAPKGAPVGGFSDYDIETTTLPNKIVVASAENEGSISRVSVIFRAGARFETFDNLGVTHVLRIAAGLSTKGLSQFAIIRNLQERGSTLTCSADRETIAYTLEGTRPALDETLPFLTEIATQQCFRPWEVSDNIPRLQLELATRPPQLRAVDLLHKAAFRSRGLGNSLYISKHQLGKISAETLQHYVCRNFTADRTAVVGLGVNHKELVDYAKSLCIDSSGSSDSIESPYKGGEIRSDKGGNLAHVAIAGKGGNLRNAKDALSFAVLQRALGAGSSIIHTKENNAPFAKIAGSGQLTSVTALNVSYSDCGLFGVLISAPGSEVTPLIEKTVEILKNGKVSDADVTRGKNQLKTAIQLALEDGKTAIEYMENQAVLTGCVANTAQIVKTIDGLTTSDINAALKNLASSKLSIASVGMLYGVPFLDELK